MYRWFRHQHKFKLNKGLYFSFSINLEHGWLSSPYYEGGGLPSFINTTDHSENFTNTVNGECALLRELSTLGNNLGCKIKIHWAYHDLCWQGHEKIKDNWKLCGTGWRTFPKTLRTTYTSLIRLIMEYASLIWDHTSKFVLRKLESVKTRTSKIITFIMSSSNNLKVIQECCNIAPGGHSQFL